MLKERGEKSLLNPMPLFMELTLSLKPDTICQREASQVLTPGRGLQTLLFFVCVTFSLWKQSPVSALHSAVCMGTPRDPFLKPQDCRGAA